MKRLMKHGPGLLAVSVLAGLSVLSCTQAELIEPEQPKSPTAFEYVGNPTEAYLDITVSGLTVDALTKAEIGNGPVDDTEAERRVNNLWIFQFDKSSGDLISDPQYITIQTDNQQILRNIPVTLSDNNGAASVVYVVTNTDDSDWASYDKTAETYTGFTTLTLLKEHTIPNPAPIRLAAVSGDGGTSESDLSIPMSGSNGEDDESLIITKDIVVKVPVRRMFAKMNVTVNLATEETYDGSSISSFMIEKIPNTCTVATNYNGETWYYPSLGGYDVSRTFDPGTATTGDDGSLTYGPFTIYIPENLQGSQSDAVKLTPFIKAYVNNAEITSRPSFTAYPGSWVGSQDENVSEGSNYDIQRNCYYDINLNVVLADDSDIITASANCIIVYVGRTVAFYPYVRDEQLTSEMSSSNELKKRYTFSNYLDWEDTTGEKQISKIKIIWQTEGFLGDVTKNNNVWIDNAADVKDEQHRKIYVSPLTYGNALLGAYNSKDVLLWSWHIWCPEVDPESTAIEYYHLQWDSGGIYEDNYVPGRLVMNLNLGAIHATPAVDGALDTDTYGMLYQWGRKDPFPPVKAVADTPGIKGGKSFFNYADYYLDDGDDDRNYNISVGVYDTYGNKIDLKENDGSIDATSGTEVFFTDSAVSEIGGTLSRDDNDVILASVRNPTMFIAASPKYTNTGSTTSTKTKKYLDDIGTYYNEGDWLPDEDDLLWGGGHTGDEDGDVMELHVYSNTSSGGIVNNYDIDAWLENDYGPEKTIFDPCPYGWRVSSGDIWLGFTKTGLNYGHTSKSSNTFFDECNAVKSKEDPAEALIDITKETGFRMYMQGWKGSKGSATSFFPSQGTRVSSGQPYNVGPICGNYHNATVDRDMELYNDDGEDIGSIRRVDILHFHSQNTTGTTNVVDGQYVLLRQFTTELHYYDKSVAGPIRCVRDTEL